jgi:hypothetical protein
MDDRDDEMTGPLGPSSCHLVISTRPGLSPKCDVKCDVIKGSVLMSEFHDKFQCYVRSLHYDYEKHAGRLVMDELSCTDMLGCIAIFMVIDPNVQLIDTVQHSGCGGYRDTTYRKIGGAWHADGGKVEGSTTENRWAPDAGPPVRKLWRVRWYRDRRVK